MAFGILLVRLMPEYFIILREIIFKELFLKWATDMEQKNKLIHPFLRWTGSKRWFIKDHIEGYVPEKFNNYYEPFLGSASVFFYIRSKAAELERSFFLSDSNSELINAYTQLRDYPDLVIDQLKKLKNSEKEYYVIRNLKPRSPEKQAARFIYLNRTSFNGIYRVNSSGEYNVPYGHRQKVDVVTEQILLGISNVLQGVNINCANFDESLKSVNENDLVFLDPPYTVAHENNGFIEYNQRLFSWEDQEKLKRQIDIIIEKKAFFILTNASHFSITELYKGIGSITKLSRQGKVGGRNKTRGLFNELVIHNIL